MADIIYDYSGSTYINITNKCPCRCTFCIRSNFDAIGSANSLWFEKEPTLDDIKKAVDDYDFTRVENAVFCGYGEPTNALENLIETAKYIKSVNPSIRLRLNTNGLSDLINEKETAELICSVMDSVSVSLNETTSEKYDAITKNRFPGKAFDAMLKFTSDCVKYCDDVRMTVVDVISPEDIEKSRQICESTGAAFRVRHYSE